MAWIKSCQELQGHPKTKRLARMLGVSVPDAIGRLHLLWWWALDYAQDGDLSKFDAYDIADAVMWDGEPQTLLDALIQCGGKGHGFLDMTEDGGLRIHDWDEHCGREFEKREKAAERLRKFRAKKNSDTTPDSASDVRNANETGTKRERNANETGTYVVRGEEKRGEERRGDITPPTPPSQGGVGAGEEAAVDKPVDKPEYPPEFETFWGAYPRGIEKKAAYKAWLGVTRHGADPGSVAEAAREYAKAAAAKGTPPDKLKHPATFLHEDRWRDWLPPDGAAYLEAVRGARSMPGGRGRDSPGGLGGWQSKLTNLFGGDAIDVETRELEGDND